MVDGRAGLTVGWMVVAMAALTALMLVAGSVERTVVEMAGKMGKQWVASMAVSMVDWKVVEKVVEKVETMVDRKVETMAGGSVALRGKSKVV